MERCASLDVARVECERFLEIGEAARDQAPHQHAILEVDPASGIRHLCPARRDILADGPAGILRLVYKGWRCMQIPVIAIVGVRRAVALRSPA